VENESKQGLTVLVSIHSAGKMTLYGRWGA
jgi:hypothetical protein